MAMSVSRKANIVSLTVVLLGGVLVAWAPFYFATREMRRWCAALPLGLSYADAQARVAEQGYVISPLVDGEAVVEDPPSYGRRSCELHFGAEGLLSSE
jgi:hypothetical protein